MNRLKELRNDKGLRQKDVAQVLGISQQSLGYYENGVNKPDPAMLVQLADFYEVSVDFLLGRTDETGIIYKYNGEKLSNDEQKLLVYYRSLSAQQKDLAILTLQTWSGVK